MSEAHALSLDFEDKSTGASLLGLKLQLLANSITSLINESEQSQIDEPDDQSFAISEDLAVVYSINKFNKTLNESDVIDETDFDEGLEFNLKPRSERIIRVRIVERTKAKFRFPYDDPNYTDFDE